MIEIERDLVPFDEGQVVLNTGRTKTYQLLNAGLIEGRKEGRSTLLSLASIRRYQSNLPRYRPRRANSDGSNGDTPADTGEAVSGTSRDEPPKQTVGAPRTNRKQGLDKVFELNKMCRDGK